MIISEFNVYPVKIPLNTPFIISDSIQTQYFGALLELKTEDGLVGWGEAAPSARVTGETTPAVIDALNKNVKTKIIGQDIMDIEKILETIETTIPQQPTALTALDTAMHDLVGKKAGLPVKHLLGGYRDKIPISFTVVIGSVEETIRSAQEYINAGAKVLKVKLGADPVEDMARIRALRIAFGYDYKITADANQGYSVIQAIRTLNIISRYELEFVEQPIDAKNIIGLKEVKKRVDVPIMADESAQNVSDVDKLVRDEVVDMINIKLMKCGGLRNAVKISNITEAAGIPCQIGCMIETGVGIIAGTHLALALKNIKYADLDGHIFLESDITTDHQITVDGFNRISGRPGLGVDVKPYMDLVIDDKC